MRVPDEKTSCVAFCADAGYIEFVPAAIESIIRCGVTNADWANFHVLTDREPGRKLRDLLAQVSGGRFEIHLIDASRFSSFKEVTHISRGMYYRLLLPDVLEEDLILYLDCDILARHDLTEIFATDLQDKIAAAVVNPFYDAASAGLGDCQLYFNSGVMLIDRRKWVAADVTAITMSYLANNMKSVRMPDQDALNHSLRDRWIELDPTYNCQTSMLARCEELGLEIGSRWSTEFLGDPVLVHFSSSHKQWHRTSRIKFEADYNRLTTHRKVKRRGYFLDIVTAVVRRFIFRANPHFY